MRLALVDRLYRRMVPPTPCLHLAIYASSLRDAQERRILDQQAAELRKLEKELSMAMAEVLFSTQVYVERERATRLSGHACTEAQTHDG